MQSLENALVGRGGAITDAGGHVWSIDAQARVTVDGVVDASTANVTHLAYAQGVVWQENTQNLWWGKTSPTAAWSPSYGTATPPVPIPGVSANDIMARGEGAIITDASGNDWVIASGHVVVNGAVFWLKLSATTQTIGMTQMTASTVSTTWATTSPAMRRACMPPWASCSSCEKVAAAWSRVDSAVTGNPPRSCTSRCCGT